MKKRKWIIIGSLFLAAAIFLLGVSDYTQNIAPRLESIGLTYRPFSGKLFDLAPAQVRSVFIRRGIPGREQEYGQDSRHSMISADTPAEIEKMVERFNSFRYYFKWPEPHTYRDTAPGIVYNIHLYDPAGSPQGYSILGWITEDRIWVGEFPPGVDEAKGAWYYGGRDLYDALMALE